MHSHLPSASSVYFLFSFLNNHHTGMNCVRHLAVYPSIMTPPWPAPFALISMRFDGVANGLCFPYKQSMGWIAAYRPYFHVKRQCLLLCRNRAFLTVNFPLSRLYLYVKEVFRRQIYHQLVDLDRAHLLVCVLKRQFIHLCVFKLVDVRYKLYWAIKKFYFKVRFSNAGSIKNEKASMIIHKYKGVAVVRIFSVGLWALWVSKTPGNSFFSAYNSQRGFHTFPTKTEWMMSLIDRLDDFFSTFASPLLWIWPLQSPLAHNFILSLLIEAMGVECGPFYLM